MKKFTKILALVLAFVLTAALSVSLTLAYLTDTDEAVNVMTFGNVSIEQHEYERVMDANGNPVEGVEGVDFTANYGITKSYKLQEFTQAKPAYPAVYSDGGQKYDEFQQLWNQVGAPGSNDLFDDSMENVVDKFVFVENTGKSDCYYRTLIAVELPEGVDGSLIHLNMTTNDRFDCSNVGSIYLDGVRYTLYNMTYNQVLTPGEVSRPSLLQLFLDPAATNEDCAAFGDTWEILVVSQAVQTKGFASAQAALNAAFGAISTTNHPWTTGANVPALVNTAEELATALNSGKNVILNADIEDAPVTTIAPYGNYYGVYQNGGTLDGNGNVLDFDLGNMHGGKYDNYGIMTSGGTIKNAAIGGVFRGIMIMSPQQDVVIDNVVIDDEDVCYAINTGEKGASGIDLTVTNSVIKGWTSIGDAIESVSFTNCTFGQGTYYTNVYGRLVKPYVNAVFENCEFGSMYYIDLSALAADQTVTLRNCTVNGVKLTAENWTTLVAPEATCGAGQISIELRGGTYMTAANVADYVIFE